MRDKITKPVPGEADFVPSMGFDGTYRDIEYVLAELRGLVSQMMPCSTAA